MNCLLQAGAPAQGPVAAFVVALVPNDDSDGGGRRRGLLQLETKALVRVVARILTSHAVAGETALRDLVVRRLPCALIRFDKPARLLHSTYPYDQTER